jgi:hypothetical protein
MSQLIVFDVDGTLANCEHRQHWVKNKPRNWAAFNSAMHLDTPHTDIIWMFNTLYEAGATLLIASGRGAEQRGVTEHWLDVVAGLSGKYERLYMRPAGDYRSDVIVKSEILDLIIQDYGRTPDMVFDDRDGVVQMWRDRGIRCLQVAPGAF